MGYRSATIEHAGESHDASGRDFHAELARLLAAEQSLEPVGYFREGRHRLSARCCRSIDDSSNTKLVNAGAQHYQRAARRLARMRKLAAETDQAEAVDTFIAELRDTHRLRPRLQQEFDRARLP